MTRVPCSTYRVQLHAGFGFDDAAGIAGYLHDLGIGDLYASPILAARSGSTHGYDVADPTRLNPELGGEGGFERLAAGLRDRGMGLLVDIVPNHMAAGPDNPWWSDVLERGRESPFASFFDIDWEAPHQMGKVVLPILGDRYPEVLERGELRLVVEDGRLRLAYLDLRLPVAPAACDLVLERAGVGPGGPGRFRSAWEERGEDRSRIQKLLRRANRGGASATELLDEIVQAQAYRLCHWQLAPYEINYRRFFDISDLVCMRASEAPVLDTSHALILRLVAEGAVTGLRIDHLDGIGDPLGYLEALQARLGGADPAYVVAEKILAGEEELPREWPVSGTTGYDAGAAINGVFVDERGAAELDRVYRRFTREERSFREISLDGKRNALAQLFPGEVDALAGWLYALAGRDRAGRDLARAQLHRALVEVTAALPVYRTYLREPSVRLADRAVVRDAVALASRELALADHPALHFVERVILLAVPDAVVPDALAFVARWQQLSGPVAAKGVEDTALYRYHALLSRNEVGDDPAGETGVEAFHRAMRSRQRSWPHALTATSTHDSKRGEDVRARLDVLSEIPEEWARRLDRWAAWNHGRKKEVAGVAVPDRGEEGLVYQTLLGAWPLDGDEIGFRRRLDAFLVKALREAKLHTSWTSPDERYEKAVLAFVRSVLAPSNARWRRDFRELQERLAWFGFLNSLGQVLLKVAAPGVPDFYQGSELWTLTLVDPDNRRPVDFGRRRKMLDGLAARDADRALPAELLKGWNDGRVKLWLTWKALTFRRSNPELFAAGAYVRLDATGRLRTSVCASARRKGRAWVVALVPRLLAEVARAGEIPLGSFWGRTSLVLPARAPRSWRNVLTREPVEAGGGETGTIAVGDALASFPVALLESV